MNKSSSVVTQKPSSSASAWANGPPSASPRSPSATTPGTPTHSRKSSTLAPAVSLKDGVSVPKGIVPSSSSHRSSGINFGTIDANGPSGPSAAAPTATAVSSVVNGSAGTPPPSKDAPASYPSAKAFGSVSAQTPSTTTAASSTAAPSPTPSNTSTAATSAANAPPRRKLDANKLFQVPTSSAPQPAPSAAPPSNTTGPPPSSAVPPFHPNAPNSSVMAANVAANSPSQRFQTLPPPVNHGPYYHSPQMANQQPVGVGGPPSHLRPGPGPAAGGPRSPSFSNRPPINGAGPPPPTVAVNGAGQGRGPQSAAGQPTGAPTGTVPQVASPRLGHQPPAVMQHQQQQPPGPAQAPGQMPGQAPYPPQQMQMGWQQPQYGGWQSQYPYPYMNQEWYPSHMQHPHMHQHPHQPPYMQPPGTPHQPYPSALPPVQQPPNTANTMSPRTGPMPTLPPQPAGASIPHPSTPQINTNIPSVPSTPAPGRPAMTTPLTAGAREFVPGGMGGSSSMIPSPGFPLPKKSAAIKISNPNTGEAVVLRPPDGGHSRTLSRDTATVHESSPLRKGPIRIENPEEKKAREEKDRKAKEELDAKKRKEEEDKKKKEEEEKEAQRKAEEAERLRIEAEERQKKEAEEKAKREEEARLRLEEEKKRQEEEAAKRKKEEERLQREAEEQKRKEAEEQKRKEEEEHRVRKEREERERKEREEAEAKAKAEEERLRKEAEEAARLAAEVKAKEEAEAKEREEREKLQAPALSRTASTSSVATPLTSSPKPPSASLPAKPSLPPISTNSDRPRMQRPVPGPLDLSSTQRPPVTPGLLSALASARKIDDLDSVTYPEGIKTPSVELNQGHTKGGKYKYDRDFLLQFMALCKDKPDNLSSLDTLGIERGVGGDENGPPFGSTGRPQGRRVGSMGPPSASRSASMNMGLGLTGFPGSKGGGAPFVGMGNFASPSSRMTSEERFAASNRDRAVSGGSTFIRGIPIAKSTSQGGVGGINAVPPSPGGQQSRTRSQRGRARHDSLKPNAPPTSQQQQQQQALSGFEPVAALQQSENRWTPSSVGRSKPAVDENSPQFVEKKVKGLLNKLTLENFDSLSNQIISWANKSENEKNGATLILVIKLVFEKATDEAHWSEMYARLCRKMMEQISQNVQDDNIRNAAGEPIVGGHLFRKYLLNRCQEDFERGWSQKESAQAAAALKAADDKAAEAASKAGGADDEPVLYSEEYYALLKAKRQGLGLVRFIGELFKLQMLTERIMHECIKKLLSKIDNPEEEEIESLCKLLTTVGQALDTPKAKGHMDIYFGRMQMLADNPHVASRIRYMLLDVIELRGRGWRPRNATAGPSTLAQVHEQAAKEQAAAAQQASKMVPMTRTGSQRGGRGAPEQGPDGWNVAGPTPVRAPAKAGDLSNFGKFTANPGPLKTMGPSSAFKKGDRGRETPPPSNSGPMSRATSGSNMFSLLGGPGAEAVDAMPKRTPSGRGTTRKASVDQAPQAPPDTPLRRKLQLLPRSLSTNASEDGGAGEDKPESDEEQAPAATTKSYTEKEAKAKVEEDVKEFFNIRDVSEGEKSFAELPDEHKKKLVDGLASKALDKKEADVKLVAELFERVAGKVCPPSAFEEGLGGIIEFLDDMVMDVPQAYAFMARLLRGSRLPQATVESLADKIFADGDPAVKPKDKLLKAYAALA